MGERPPGRLVPRPTGCGYPHVRLVMHVLNYAGTPQRGQTWRRAVKSSGRRTARRTRQADWKPTGRPASTGPQALQDRRLSEGHKSHERPGDSVGFHTACWVSAAYPNPNARDYVYTQDSPAIPRGGPDGSANCRRCAPDGTGRRMSRISKADEKALLAQLHDCLADFIEAAVADLREIAAIRRQAREHGLDIPEDIRQQFQEARKLATLFSPHSLGFFSVHTILDVRRGLTVPACLGDRRNTTGSGLLASVAAASRHHRTVAIGPDSKGSFKRFKGEEWEMFNSTDEVWPP